jgi:hypothetical protein
MEKDAFESVVARVYAGTLEEAMATVVLDQSASKVCNIAPFGKTRNAFTNSLGFVGYA